MWSPPPQQLAKIFKRTRREWGEINKWRCRRSVSLFCRETEKESEREREWASLPTIRQCDRRRLFLFPAVTMQWVLPRFCSERNCFPCQSEEVELKAGYMKTPCTPLFDMSQISSQCRPDYSLFRVWDQTLLSSMHTHTQSPPGCTYWQWAVPLWTLSIWEIIEERQRATVGSVLYTEKSQGIGFMLLLHRLNKQDRTSYSALDVLLHLITIKTD